MTCIKCNGEIDSTIIEAKAEAMQRLYPNRIPTPPKVCSSCLWLALKDLESDREPSAGTSERWGVLLTVYDGEEMNQWIHDDVEGTHIAAFDDFARAASLARKYNDRNPKGRYVVRKALTDPEAADPECARAGCPSASGGPTRG